MQSQIWALVLIILTESYAEEDIWRLKTDTLPIDEGEPKLMPMLGNGHIGINVFQPSGRKQCLYSNTGDPGASHRTRLARTYSDIRLNASGTYTYTLDMKKGVFEETVINDEYYATHSLLVHRYIPGLILNSVEVTLSKNTNSIIEIPLRYSGISDDTVEDIDFFSDPITLELGENILGIETMKYACGSTQVKESVAGSWREDHVCIGWTPISNLVVTGQDASVTKNFITVISETEEGFSKQINKIVEMGLDSLLDLHIAAWEEIWSEGSIILEGDLNLAQTVVASLFYIYSSLPMRWDPEIETSGFCGLSPGGLSYGALGKDYQGHSFWDTEIWMFPSILVLQPSQGRELLNYRLERLETARQHAKDGGWEGARFPWESALTGAEVCPDFAAETRENQVHISADISFAARQYLSVTGDLSWFMESQGYNTGCDMMTDISSYWASRISSDGNEMSEILSVMGPDEDHGSVDNNGYTNVVAGYSIYFSDFLTCAAECSPIPAQVLQKAKRLKFEYNQGMDYHPQYSGYTVGTKIKQADTVLLGYPLMYPMNTSTRGNDLFLYGEVVRSDGPAMTWGMHAIGHVEVENFEEAAVFFNKSYQPYARAPFLMWTEQQAPDIGAVNFITGMGGFLQSIIFGYVGLRTKLDKMEFNPQLPQNSRGLTLIGLDYHGSVFDLTIDQTTTTLDFTRLMGSLMIRQGKDEILVDSEMLLKLRKAPFSIHPVDVDFLERCELPLDLIGL